MVEMTELCSSSQKTLGQCHIPLKLLCFSEVNQNFHLDMQAYLEKKYIYQVTIEVAIKQMHLIVTIDFLREKLMGNVPEPKDFQHFSIDASYD